MLIEIDLLISRTDGKCPVCSSEQFLVEADSLIQLTDTTFETDDNSSEAFLNECSNGHQSVWFDNVQYKAI